MNVNKNVNANFACNICKSADVWHEKYIVSHAGCREHNRFLYCVCSLDISGCPLVPHTFTATGKYHMCDTVAQPEVPRSDHDGHSLPSVQSAWLSAMVACCHDLTYFVAQCGYNRLSVG
jgi:hypothetical protein